MEQAIVEIDMRKSVSRYQLVVDKAMVRLNFAVCPGAWLMPGEMIINTESVIGYNNALKQAGNGVKLGINNDINLETKKASSLKQMQGFVPKTNVKKQSSTGTSPTKKKVFVGFSSDSDQHEDNKKAVIVGVIAIAVFLIIVSK